MLVDSTFEEDPDTGISMEIYRRLNSTQIARASDEDITSNISPSPIKQPSPDSGYNLRERCIKKQKICNEDEDDYESDTSTSRSDESKENLQSIKKKRIQKPPKPTTSIPPTGAYLVMKCANTIKVFKHCNDTPNYTEVLKMPNRHVVLPERLMIDIHFSDSRIYIAYLDNLKREQSFVEVRDLNGRLIYQPRYYDNLIHSIKSDKDLIYLITAKNVIYVHKKRYFNFSSHRIDLQFLQAPLVDLVIKTPSHVTNMVKFHLQLATPHHIVLAEYDALNKLSLNQAFDFRSELKTRQALFKHDLVVILRTSGEGNMSSSKLEIGRILKFPDGRKYFVHERSIKFKYIILQIELGDDYDLILFAYSRYKGRNRFEIGCLNLKTFTPVWATFLIGEHHLNDKISFLAGHLVVSKDSHNHCIMDIRDHTKFCNTCGLRLFSKDPILHETHCGMFRNHELTTNVHLFRPCETDQTSLLSSTLG